MSNIELRPAAPGDLGAVCELKNRVEQAEGVPRVLTVEELRESLSVPFLDLAEDTRVAWRDGRIAGFASVWHPPDDHHQQAYLEGEVDPDRRGHGVGRALLGWSIARAAERMCRSPARSKHLRVGAYEWSEPNHRLYARFGFTPVRWFDELLRPLDPPIDLAAPDAVTILPWPRGRDDEILTMRNRAFREHWGTTPMDASRWDRMLHGHGARLDLSAVAVATEDDEIVSISLNHAYPEDDALTGRSEAWIENLATASEWRRRGLASALIAWSLTAFDRAGFTHAALSVDADNPTGAAGLYKALGFESIRRSVVHQLEIR